MSTNQDIYNCTFDSVFFEIDNKNMKYSRDVTILDLLNLTKLQNLIEELISKINEKTGLEEYLDFRTLFFSEFIYFRNPRWLFDFNIYLNGYIEAINNSPNEIYRRKYNYYKDGYNRNAPSPLSEDEKSNLEKAILPGLEEIGDDLISLEKLFNIPYFKDDLRERLLSQPGTLRQKNLKGSESNTWMNKNYYNNPKFYLDLYSQEVSRWNKKSKTFVNVGHLAMITTKNISFTFSNKASTEINTEGLKLYKKLMDEYFSFFSNSYPRITEGDLREWNKGCDSYQVLEATKYDVPFFDYVKNCPNLVEKGIDSFLSELDKKRIDFFLDNIFEDKEETWLKIIIDWFDTKMGINYLEGKDVSFYKKFSENFVESFLGLKHTQQNFKQLAICDVFENVVGEKYFHEEIFELLNNDQKEIIFQQYKKLLLLNIKSKERKIDNELINLFLKLSTESEVKDFIFNEYRKNREAVFAVLESLLETRQKKWDKIIDSFFLYLFDDLKNHRRVRNYGTLLSPTRLFNILFSIPDKNQVEKLLLSTTISSLILRYPRKTELNESLAKLITDRRFENLAATRILDSKYFNSAYSFTLHNNDIENLFKLGYPVSKSYFFNWVLSPNGHKWMSSPQGDSWLKSRYSQEWKSLGISETYKKVFLDRENVGKITNEDGLNEYRNLISKVNGNKEITTEYLLANYYETIEYILAKEVKIVENIDLENCETSGKIINYLNRIEEFSFEQLEDDTCLAIANHLIQNDKTINDNHILQIIRDNATDYFSYDPKWTSWLTSGKSKKLFSEVDFVGSEMEADMVSNYSAGVSKNSQKIFLNYFEYNHDSYMERYLNSGTIFPTWLLKNRLVIQKLPNYPDVIEEIGNSYFGGENRYFNPFDTLWFVKFIQTYSKESKDDIKKIKVNKIIKKKCKCKDSVVKETKNAYGSFSDLIKVLAFYNLEKAFDTNRPYRCPQNNQLWHTSSSWV